MFLNIPKKHCGVTEMPGKSYFPDTRAHACLIGPSKGHHIINFVFIFVCEMRPKINLSYSIARSVKIIAL